MCPAAQASQKVGTQEGSSGLDLRKPGLGRERSGFVGWGQGPKRDWHEEKMKKLVEGGGESEKRESGKGAPGEGLRRGGAGRGGGAEAGEEQLPRGKGKSDGGTSEGRREEPREEKLEKSQGEGWEMT